jgi:hypothetical protein
MIHTSFLSFCVTLAIVGLAGVFLLNFQWSNTVRSASESQIRGDAKPAQITPISGTDLNRVTLTERASQRLAIETDAVLIAPTALARKGGGRTVIPYAAVIYDVVGTTWTYTNPEPLVYVRHRIIIDYIAQDLAVLTDGPPVGTLVVKTGAAELLGAEFGIGK